MMHHPVGGGAIRVGEARAYCPAGITFSIPVSFSRENFFVPVPVSVIGLEMWLICERKCHMMKKKMTVIMFELGF